MGNETVCIDRKIISELARMIKEINDKVEALELASDPEVMESLKRSKEQIEKGELVDFDEL